MKKVLVTGANGFVGHHLIKVLAENGCHIYAVIRNEKENISNIADVSNVEIIYCDMEQISELPKLIPDREIECVYHLAWAGSSGDLRMNYELQMKNVLWTCKLVETMAEMKIKRLLVAGSVTQLMYREYLTEDGITPEMVTCYAIGKISTEYMCKCLCVKHEINLCWTYISNFYGADDPTNNFINFLIKNYSENKVPSLTPAEQLADFTYVTDIAKGLVYACERGKKNASYYIGYGRPRPLREFVQEVRDVVNPKIESGIGLKDFNGKDIDFSKIDVLKLERDTGYKADICFTDGVKMCFDRL
ncbi:MAG: NAD-dependent epimerase/dehydratase family protein [Suilimivivens sp.]